MQKLQTVNAETLLYEPLEKPSFVVDSLIPTGLSLFCGSQKIGNWKKKAYCAKRASTNDYQSRIYRHTDRCRSVCPDYLRGYSEEDCRGRHLRQ